MTKKIRIENADTSDHKVVVQVWQTNNTHLGSDIKVREIELNHPTQMVEEHIHSGQYLTIKEVAA